MIIRPSSRGALGALLVALGLGAMIVASINSAPSEQLTYGASRVDGDPGIAIHWVRCDDATSSTVDLEGYRGGSRLPTGVPVFWQVRADQAGSGTTIETYVVGETPAGSYETVPLRRQLPNDRLSISAPPGDASARAGMSFRLGDLRRDAMYRGDYRHVSPEQFEADGEAYCAIGLGSPLSPLGVFAAGAAAAVLAGRRRPLALVVAIIVMGSGLLALSGVARGVAVGERQTQAAFTSGATVVPSEREVLLAMSPTTHRPRAAGGSYVARFVAPASYSFAVSCDGPSIHIGESARIENGGTGGRQLIGCATGRLVDGSIADHPGRSELVEVVVDPNGMEDWQLVVLAGRGEIGPFDEP